MFPEGHSGFKEEPVVYIKHDSCLKEDKRQFILEPISTAWEQGSLKWYALV